MTKNGKAHGVRIYRATRGNFDTWRSYSVVSGDKVVCRLSAGRVICFPADTRSIHVEAGRYRSKTIDLSTPQDDLLICELSANPKSDKKPLRLEWISEEDVQQRLLRFDRPPYVGGKTVGLITALGAMLAFAVGGMLVLITSILRIIHAPSVGDMFTVLFLGIAGSFLSLFCLFVVSTGLRSTLSYFRLPPEWRH